MVHTAAPDHALRCLATKTTGAFCLARHPGLRRVWRTRRTPTFWRRAPASAPPLDADTHAALHAQAVAMLNVKALVPVTLDLATGNYARCRGLFLVVLGKYALTDHVLYDAPLPNHADWAQMDCVVLGWRTISHDLLQEVMSPTATTRSIWHDLEFQILENCELRAINLSTEFHGFTQGDISIFEYCRRLNTMADNLADLGEPQSDRMLINGLSTKYGHAISSSYAASLP